MAEGTFGVARSLARGLWQALKADERTGALIQRRRGDPRPSGTGGHYVRVAQVSQGITVQLWFDTYSGLTSPRAWVGFYSNSASRIARLATVGAGAGLDGRVIRRYRRDIVRRKGVWQFKQPLRANQFDVQVLENYDSTDYYLGLYLPYEWPFTRNTRRQIVRDSVNYVAALSTAVATVAGSTRVRKVGPWNRPDKAVEASAIKYVRAWLKRRGYQVRSRESDICGYDLHAVRDGRELHVEVKGVANNVPRFFISRTELNEATRNRRWRLAVVTSARRSPKLLPFVSGNRVKQMYDLQPTQWHATRSGLMR